MRLQPIGFAFLLAACVANAQSINPKPGSENPIKKNQLAWYQLEGLTAEQLAGATLYFFPRENVIIIPGQTWGGDPYVLFQARSDGTFLLGLCWATGNLETKSAEYQVVVGDGTPPEPPEPPEPKPPPEPEPEPLPAFAKDVYDLAKLYAPKERFLLRTLSLGYATESSKIAAGAYATNQEVVDGARQRNREIIKSKRDAWLPFFEALRDAINAELRDGGKLKEPGDHVKYWREIGQGLGRYADEL